MAKVRKSQTRPLPDLAAATRAVLERAAEWVERDAAVDDLHGPAAKRTPEEWRALDQARALAANYIRMGARK